MSSSLGGVPLPKLKSSLIYGGSLPKKSFTLITIPSGHFINLTFHCTCSPDDPSVYRPFSKNLVVMQTRVFTFDADEVSISGNFLCSHELPNLRKVNTGRAGLPLCIRAES